MKRFCIFAALFFSLGATCRADSMTATVNTQQITGPGWSETYWTFQSGIAPFWSTQFNEYLPLTLQDYATGTEHDWRASYTILQQVSSCAEFLAGRPGTTCMNTRDTVTLSDVNGWISGLPGQCTGDCKNVLMSDTVAPTPVGMLGNLNTSLVPTPEPETVALFGTGLVSFMALGFWRKPRA